MNNENPHISISLDAKIFMENELKTHNIPYSMLKNDFELFCPFHSHEFRKKHLKIRFDGVLSNCYACGKGRGGWNVVAAKLGLAQLPNHIKYGFEGLERELEKTTKHTFEYLELPKDLTPFEGDYRGIPEEFLRKFGSLLYYDPFSAENRILWPVTFEGELCGWTAGRLDGTLLPKYRNGPGDLFKAKTAYFGIDDPLVQDTVVLTEGPYSALRLLWLGIPAVAILGVAQWGDSKAILLSQRKTPIKNIIIAMDGDKAGDECVLKIVKTLDKYYSNVVVFPTPREKDPGDMDIEYVEKLREMYLKML